MREKEHLTERPAERPAERVWRQAKDAMLDALVSVPVMHYTQLSIGVIGRKP